MEVLRGEVSSAGGFPVLAELFEDGGVGGEVGVVDLAVEVDNDFELADRLIKVADISVDHCDVESGHRLTGDRAGEEIGRAHV